MERNQLIISHIPLVERLAKYKKRAVPSCIHLEDLIAAGNLGLTKAAHNYREEEGQFENFAIKRILGEMTDYLREIGYCRGGGRQGGWTPFVMISLERLKCDLPYEDEPIEDSFEEVTKILPQLGKLMMRWYYMDGLTCKQIGERLGVSESRVSQMLKEHKRSISESVAA